MLSVESLNLRRALLFSLIFNSALIFSGVYATSYDAYTHMFFADHYQRSWFDTWEPRWYTGFDVSSYPPLVHQIMALIGRFVGVESAFAILSLTLMLLLPTAVYEFTKIFLAEREAGVASVISVFMPGIVMTNYFFGQITTLFALVSTLLMCKYLHDFLMRGSSRELTLSAAFLGVTAGAHHLTAIFFAPLMVATVSSFMIYQGKKVLFNERYSRVATFAACSILVYLAVTPTFWAFALNRPTQVEIHHLSRSNLFLDMRAFLMFFLGIYGFTAFFIPVVVFLALKNKNLFFLSMAFLPLFFLGLGGTTPIPELAFGKAWKWLTYDRFALWASVLMIPLLAVVIERFRVRRVLLSLFIVLLILSGAAVGNMSRYIRTQPPPVDLEPITDFLNRDGHWNWRYLTLGLGDRISLLSIKTNASTVDGNYPTGRTLPVLMRSGVDKLDGAKYWDGGVQILEQVLRDAPSYNLRWVFCNDKVYENILVNNGFTLIDRLQNGVSLWDKGDVPPIQNDKAVGEATVFTYIRGIAPISLLAVSLALILPRRVINADIS